MKSIALALALSFFAESSLALTCRDLFVSTSGQTGKFVTVSGASPAEQKLIADHAPQSSVLLRSSNASALILKTPSPSTLEKIVVVDTKTGAVTHEAIGFSVKNVAVSSNGDFLYVESEGSIRMFGRGDGNIVNTVPSFWRSSGMMLSANGKALYTFSSSSPGLIIVETKYLETGYSLPHFAGDGSRGSHLFPLHRERILQASGTMSFSQNSTGRYVVTVADKGGVVVLDTTYNGNSVIPGVIFQGYSEAVQNNFSTRTAASPEIKWTSEHSFEISINGRTEVFEFKPIAN